MAAAAFFCLVRLVPSSSTPNVLGEDSNAESGVVGIVANVGSKKCPQWAMGNGQWAMRTSSAPPVFPLPTADCPLPILTGHAASE